MRNRLLIITVTKIEGQAVIEVFSKASDRKWERKHIGKKIYYDLGTIGGVEVFMVQTEMGTSGPGGALITIRNAIDAISPTAVIMVGIAFGVNPKKQQLGDILVSRQLLAYELQKIPQRSKPILRGDRVTASIELLDKFRSAEMDWSGAKVHFGLILSGEKLVNNRTFRAHLLSYEPEAIGGEMEGAGLYAAAQDAKVDWILVKAICDWADGRKNDNAQTLAAFNAAKFLLHVIECVAWEISPPIKVTNTPEDTSSDHDSTETTEPVQGLPADSARQYMIEFLLKDFIRSKEACKEALDRLEEIEPEEAGDLHKALGQKLLLIMKDPSYEMQERIQAGNALNDFGDPRFNPDTWFLPNDDFWGFIEIPGGPFLMGTDQENVGLRAREGPQHEIHLPRYYIGRYLVTLDQYHFFLKDHSPKNYYANQNNSKLGNFPAVDVTWYDALQYCEWLTERFRNWAKTPTPIVNLFNLQSRHEDWVVTLPSEAEWEKAARGSKDSRNFPWGSHVGPNQANFRGNGLDATTPVGCFEGGQSPYGVFDLSGNVWEWTRSNWGSNLDRPQFKYPYQIQDGRENLFASENILKVIRGGSFNSTIDEIRCSFRGAALMNTKQGHIGFRLVITELSRP